MDASNKFGSASTFIPPASTKELGSPTLDPRKSMSDRFDNPETIEKRVAKMNLTEDQKNSMLEEFKKVDKNADGEISREELHEFFEKRGVKDKF